MRPCALFTRFLSGTFRPYRVRDRMTKFSYLQGIWSRCASEMSVRKYRRAMPMNLRPRSSVVAG